jgi:hypothetical protein
MHWRSKAARASFRLRAPCRVETRVLITDRDLSGDRLQKRNFIVEPLARRARCVQTNQTEHVVAEITGTTSNERVPRLAARNRPF